MVLASLKVDPWSTIMTPSIGPISLAEKLIQKTKSTKTNKEEEDIFTVENVLWKYL